MALTIGPRDDADGLSLSRLEFGLLAALCLVLPLLEAPKNLLWLALLLVWIGRRAVARNWGGPWRGLDSVFLLFLAATVFTIVLSSPFPRHWSEATDALRFLSLVWLLSRSRVSAEQVRSLLAVLVLATIVGIVWALWAWHVAHKTQWLELHSVGHVNHSAIYIAIIGAGAVGAWSAAVTGKGWAGSRLAGVVALLFLAVVLMNESRGAAVGYAAAVLAILAANARLLGRRLPWLLGLVLLCGALAVSLNPRLLQKSEKMIEQQRMSSMRVELIHTALEGFRHDPLTGVGPGNFQALNEPTVAAWVSARGEVFERSRYFFSNHAHGLYANTAAERGLVGLAALAVLLLAWLRELWRRRPATGDTQAVLAAWAFSASSLASIAVTGLVNTTLHDEPGMLAMIAFGLMLALRDGRANPPGRP